MKHNSNVFWYSIFQVAIVVVCSSVETCVMKVFSYLFSESLNSLKQIWHFSVALWSLFITSDSCTNSCCRNVSYLIIPLYLIYNIFYKRFYPVFITVHPQWIKIISLSKQVVHIPSRWQMCVDHFCIWCLTFLVFPWFIFSLYRLSAELIYSQSLSVALIRP